MDAETRRALEIVLRRVGSMTLIGEQAQVAVGDVRACILIAKMESWEGSGAWQRADRIESALAGLPDDATLAVTPHAPKEEDAPMTQELILPCPFCGETVGGLMELASGQLACKACGCRGPKRVAWNMRNYLHGAGVDSTAGIIYYMALNALCSDGEERRRELLRILRATFPPGPEADAQYRDVLSAIHEALPEGDMI